MKDKQAKAENKEPGDAKFSVIAEALNRAENSPPDKKEVNKDRKKEKKGYENIDLLFNDDNSESDSSDNVDSSDDDSTNNAGNDLNDSNKVNDNQDGKEEEDDDVIDESKITGKASESWNKLKNSRDKWRDRYEELKAKTPEKTVDDAAVKSLSEQVELLKKERDQYKSSLDRIDYEQSPDFQDRFIKPIQEVSNKIAEILPSPEDISKDESKRLSDLSNRLSNIAGIKQNKREFFEIIDEIADDYIPVKSLRRAFENAAEELWDKTSEFHKEREKGKELSQKEVNERRKHLAGTRDNISSELDRELSDFERRANQRVGVWSSSPDFGYDKFKSIEFDKAKRLLADFAESRVITPELSELILHGALSPMDRKEKGLVASAITAQRDEIKKLKEENERLTKAMEKRGYRPGGSSGDNKDDSDEDNAGSNGSSYKGRSIIAEMIAKRRKA